MPAKYLAVLCFVGICMGIEYGSSGEKLAYELIGKWCNQSCFEFSLLPVNFWDMASMRCLGIERDIILKLMFLTHQYDLSRSLKGDASNQTVLDPFTYFNDSSGKRCFSENVLKSVTEKPLTNNSGDYDAGGFVKVKLDESETEEREWVFQETGTSIETEDNLGGVIVVPVASNEEQGVPDKTYGVVLDQFDASKSPNDDNDGIVVNDTDGVLYKDDVVFLDSVEVVTQENDALLGSGYRDGITDDIDFFSGSGNTWSDGEDDTSEESGSALNENTDTAVPISKDHIEWVTLSSNFMGDFRHDPGTKLYIYLLPLMMLVNL